MVRLVVVSSVILMPWISAPSQTNATGDPIPLPRAGDDGPTL